MNWITEYNTSLAEVKRLYGQVIQLESSINGGLKTVKLEPTTDIYSNEFNNAPGGIIDIFSSSDPDDVRNLVLCTAGAIVILATFVNFIAVFISIYFQHKKKKERLLPELNSARERWSKMDADLKETRKKIESFRDDIAQRCSELAAYKR